MVFSAPEWDCIDAATVSVQTSSIVAHTVGVCNICDYILDMSIIISRATFLLRYELKGIIFFSHRGFLNLTMDQVQLIKD